MKNFIYAGLSVYGSLAALIGATLGAVLGTLLVLPALTAAVVVVNPAFALTAIVILPIFILSCGVLGGGLGAILGTLRGALIGASFRGRSIWLIIILALVLAIVLRDFVSGLVLFIVWSGLRRQGAKLDTLNFKQVWLPYLRYYHLILIVLGFIIGAGLTGFLDDLAQQYGSISFLNLVMRHLANFLNAFSLQLTVDSAAGDFSASLDAARQHRVFQLNFGSFANFLQGLPALSLNGNLSGSVNNFFYTLQGQVSMDNGGSITTYDLSGRPLQDFLSQQHRHSLWLNLLSGGLLGALQGLVLGLIFSTLIVVADYLMIKQSNSNKPLVPMFLQEAAAPQQRQNSTRRRRKTKAS